ncbi:MAG: hypothetical protein HYR76_11555 [Ignavibacteria bacterium]|nr:hypothetical protein [Ignavibacteria bacterium]
MPIKPTAMNLGSEIASPLTGVGALRPGTIQLVVDERITPKGLHASLDRVFKLHGCPSCGLAGLDFRIRVQDKMLAEKFQDIREVRDISVQREF